MKDFDKKEILNVCNDNKIEIGSDLNEGQMLDKLMSELIEPTLIEPTFVIDYPKLILPLAKSHRGGDKNIVERFELFIGSSEFSNSFTELNDPIDQRERLQEQARLKELGDERLNQ